MLDLYMNKVNPVNLLDLWPSIRDLANTMEPKDLVTIPTSYLEKVDFIGKFIDNGHLCSLLNCDVDCGFCASVYSNIKYGKKDLDIADIK
jgi:hypothetical protein